MKEKKSVEEQISLNDPWYTEEQLQSLANPSLIRTIRARWKFYEKQIVARKTQAAGRELKVLDAGCGDGVNLTFLSRIPGLKLFACDYNPLRVERAAEQFPNVSVSRQDLSNIALGEKDFDLILCSQVLEHIPEDVAALRQLGDLLARDGVLILGVPNEGCLTARFRNHVLQPGILKNTDHFHFYTEKEIRGKFDDAGFAATDIFRENLFFPVIQMNYYLAARNWGYRLMNLLKSIFPSQAAGIYFALVRKSGI